MNHLSSTNKSKQSKSISKSKSKSKSSPPPFYTTTNHDDHHNRQNKILQVQLSVDIQDNIKSIQLLNDALSNADAYRDTTYKKEEMRLQKEYDDTTEQQKQHLAKILNDCRSFIEQKKELATTIEHLRNEKKKVKETWKEKVHQIQENKKSKLMSLRTQWISNEPIRKQNYINKRIQEIRKHTVKGLEPEVRRLVHKHQNDCAAIQKEKEDQFKLVEDEQKRLMQYELVCIKDKLEAKTRRKQDQLRAEFEKDVHHLHSKHSKTIEQIREQLLRDNADMKTKQMEERHKLSNNHSLELTNIQKIHESRINNVKQAWMKEKEIIQVNFSKHLDDYKQSINETNQKEMEKFNNELDRNLASIIKNEKERLQKMRDAKIDFVIRKTQTEIMQNTENAKMTLTNERKALQSIHKSELRKMNDIIEQWEEKHANLTSKIKNFEQEKIDLSRYLEKKKNIVTSLQHDIFIMNSEYDQKLKSRNEQMETIRQNQQKIIDEILLKKQNLMDKIDEQQKWNQKMESEHKDTLSMITSLHEKKLNDLDIKMKDDIATIEKKLITSTECLNENTIRVEFLKKKLQEYQK